jgi:hypothetical protein
MSESRLPMIDATVFMGMHHADPIVRNKSIVFFTRFYRQRIQMNFGQVGICDAIIWKKSRALQDVYYPFMDVLHTDMAIHRQGCSERALHRASTDSLLAGLDTEKKLVAAQVLEYELEFYTHDSQLWEIETLRPFLMEFKDNQPEEGFPPTLQHLYQKSCAMVIRDEDFQHVW